MDCLDQYRENLSQDHGDIPYFSDKDGRTDAKVLFVLSDPGPKVKDTMKIDRDNPDTTAKNFREANDAAKLARTDTISWNIVPWFTNNVKEDMKEGIGCLLKLIEECLPQLKVVVLMGGDARRATYRLYQDRPDLAVIHSPHPSGQALTRPGKRVQLRLAVGTAKLDVECMATGKT